MGTLTFSKTQPFEIGSPSMNNPEGLITPTSSYTICRHLRLRKSGGPTYVSQHNPQQFHNWNWTEILV